MPLPKGKPRKPNSRLSFASADGPQSKYLWTYSLEQEIGADGKKVQSRYTTRWYAKAYKQGPLVISGRCASMADQVRLGFFIRNHQKTLVDLAGHRFTVNDPALMKFSMPRENIFVQGYVPTFSIKKEGHFAPAPEFTIQFEIIFDRRHSTKDPVISFTAIDLNKVIRESSIPMELPPLTDEVDIITGNLPGNIG